MKLRWVFLVALALAVLAGAAGFGAAVLLPRGDPWLLFVASMSAIALITVPVLAGLIVANLTFDPESPDGRTGMRRLVLVVAGFELLAAAGSVVVAVAVPRAAVFAIALLVLSVALLAVGLRVGGRIQRRNAREPEKQPAAAPWSRAVIRRKVGRIVLAFGIGTIVGVVAFTMLGLALDGTGVPPFQAVLIGVTLGLLAASMACIVVSWPLVRSLRDALGSGYTEQRAIARVVLRGKDAELSTEGWRRAAEYAPIAATYLPFQVAQLALMYGGLWLQQLPNLTGSDGELSVIPLVLLIAFPILSAILFPPLVRQARRARRYAAEHAHLTPEAGSVP